MAETALTHYNQELAEALDREILPELPNRNLGIPRDKHVLLRGKSGIGKTVILSAYCKELIQERRLVLFSSARLYEGSLVRLLRRAVAQHSKRSPAYLVKAAKEAGWTIDLVVDAVDRLTGDNLTELMKGLASFALQHGARITIASSENIDLPPRVCGVTLTIDSLTIEQKQAIFNYHADRIDLPPSGFFGPLETAHAIMVAAKAAGSVPSGSSRADYYTAYLADCLPTDSRIVARALLQHLAGHMHAKLTRCLEFAEFETVARSFLDSAGGRLQVAEEVTKLPQVKITREAFSFSHDLWQDHLAAAELVFSFRDRSHALTELPRPKHRRLVPHFLHRLCTPEFREIAFERLFDIELITEGFSGALGTPWKTELANALDRLWSDLILDAGQLSVELTQPSGGGPGSFLGLRSSRQWLNAECLIAEWAGRNLQVPAIAAKFVELLGLSSTYLWEACGQAAVHGRKSQRRLFREAIHQLSHFRGPGPLTVFGMFLIYEQQNWPQDSTCRGEMPLADLLLERLPHASDPAAATVLLYLAKLLQHDSSPELARLGQVFALGWNHPISLAKLELTDVIHRHGPRLVSEAPDVAVEVRRILEEGLGSNPFLNTSIIDALNAMGVVDPPVSLAQATAEIRGVINPASDYIENHRKARDAARGLFSHIDVDIDPAACGAAGIVACFFEEIYQDVYWNAFSSLSPEDQLQFLNLAALGTKDGFCSTFILRELLKIADRSSAEVFLDHAGRLNLDHYCPTEAVARWVLGIFGCARFGLVLPEARDVLDSASAAWSIIGQLLWYDYAGLGDSQEAAEAWITLCAEASLGAADVFTHLRDAEGQITGYGEIAEVSAWNRLRAKEDEVRGIMEHSLANMARLTSKSSHPWRNEREKFVMDTIGDVGDQDTIRLLRQYVDDRGLGAQAVAAIEQISRRLSVSR